ncbi:MAG: hypothetical protein Q7R30_09245 [Acidobacteriota bacterium]|nr:hypothetical protein [Acidobacteriota bacterium]
MRSIVHGMALVLAMMTAALTGGFLYVLWTGRALDTGEAGSLHMLFQADGTEIAKIVASAIAGAVLLLPSLLVLLALPRQQRLITLGASGMPSAQVPAKTLEHHVEAAVRGVDHVQDVDVHVKQQGDHDVALSLDIRVDADADAGAMMGAVEERVAAALASPYGITTQRKPNVSIRHTNRRHKDGEQPAA